MVSIIIGMGVRCRELRSSTTSGASSPIVHYPNHDRFPAYSATELASVAIPPFTTDSR
jgi:hypothetical protein